MFYFVLILLFCFNFSFSIYSPTNPETPTITNDSFEVNNSFKKKRKFFYKVRVTLNNNDSVEGNILLFRDNILVYTKQKSFNFFKKIYFKNLSYLIINKWQKSILSTNRKSKLIRPYLFYPSFYTIVTKNSKVYKYRARIKDFERFELRNNLGKAFLYGIFYDYWIIKKKRWKYMKVFNFNNVIIPHANTWKKISFLN